MPTGRSLQLLVGRYLPNAAKDPAKALRRRVRERAADRRFRGRSLPDTTAADDAPRHVTVVVVDALRADAVDPETTPFLNSLSGTDAVAPGTWTYPSVCSLVTGRYPHEHGAMRRSDDPESATEAELTLPPELGDDVVTLPEQFAGAGYDTYGAFGFEMPMQALGGRFETHTLYTRGTAGTMLDDYRDWLSARTGLQTFAYLHLFDPHGPFDTTPPAAYRRAHDVDDDIIGDGTWRFTDEWDGADAQQYHTHRIRLYEAAVDYVDDQLADFAASLPDDHALMVTGDHGEAFGEHAAFDVKHFYDSRPAHSVGHGGTPYEAVARVPLLVDGLPIADGPASGVDLTPTLLGAAGIEVPSPVSGYDHADGLPDDRIPLVEAARYGHEKKAVYRGGWKLLVSRGDDEAVGFELPAERQADLPEDVETTLRTALPAWPGDGTGEDGDGERRVDESVQQRLSELGYT